MQRLPVDGDLATADAEKAAEVDDGGAHPAFAIDQYVDDPPHILVRQAAHVPAENALRFLGFEDGDGWRCGVLSGWAGASLRDWAISTVVKKTIANLCPIGRLRRRLKEPLDQLVAVERVAFPGAGEVSARGNDRNLQLGAARPQDFERNVVADGGGP